MISYIPGIPVKNEEKHCPSGDEEDVTPRRTIPAPIRHGSPILTKRRNHQNKVEPDQAMNLMCVDKDPILKQEQDLLLKVQKNTLLPNCFKTIFDSFIKQFNRASELEQHQSIQKEARLRLVHTALNGILHLIKNNQTSQVQIGQENFQKHTKEIKSVKGVINELKIEHKSLQKSINSQSNQLEPDMENKDAKMLHEYEAHKSDCKNSFVEQQQLQRQILILQSENDALKQSLAEMNARHQNIRIQNDSQIQYNKHNNEIVTNQKLLQENERHQQILYQCESEIQTRISEIQNIQTCLQQAQAENNHLTSLIQSKESKLNQLQLDLQNMTNEAQALSTENNRHKSELAQRTAQNTTLRSQVQNLECAHRTLLLEKERISSHYRHLVDERNQKDYSLQQCSEEQGHLISENTQLKHELETLQNHINNLEKDYHVKHYDCDVFEQQLEAFTRENDSLKRKNEATQSENHQLRLDVSSARQNINDMTSYMQELQRKLAHAEADMNSKQEMLNATDGERGALQNLLMQERDRCKSLERLLEQARSKDLAVGKEVGRLAKENAELGTLLNEMKVKEDFNGLQKSVKNAIEIEIENCNANANTQKNSDKVLIATPSTLDSYLTPNK